MQGVKGWRRALSVGLLCTVPTVVAASAQEPRAQPADTLPLWERHGPNGWTIHYRRIAKRFPQLSAIHVALPCRIKLLMQDTSAAVPVREALLPMLEPECAEVRVDAFPYSQDDIEAYVQMAEDRLVDADADPFIRFDAGREKLIVLVRNKAAIARAESRIRQDASLPAGLIVIEGRRDGIADDPQPPPPEAYVPVLNYVARHWPNMAEPVAVRRANLPDDLAPRHLTGLPVSLVGEDTCPALAVEFLPPTQLEDGTFRISLLRVSRRGGLYLPSIFEVRCTSGECFIARVTSAIADYMRRGCAAG